MKIINDVFKLKEKIVKQRLDIIPYKNVFIICNNKNVSKQLLPNISFGLNNISGDFIVVGIDSNKKDFKSLTQEDIIWILKDLEYKSFNNIKEEKNNFLPKHSNYRERNFEYDNTIKNKSFEERLINILTNIELTLASLLKK